MSNTVIFLILLLVAVFGGWALKINGGILAIIFSFLFGYFALGLGVTKTIALWPINLFITIILITYYFGFAINNGTMEGIVERTMWVTRRVPALMPIALYLLTFLLGAIGVGAYSIFTFAAPLVCSIGTAAGMHPLISLMIIVGGTCVGSYGPIGQFGVTMSNTRATHGWDAAMSSQICTAMWVNIAISWVVGFVIVYIVCKGYKIKFPQMEKPVPFTKQQKITLGIIIGAFLFMFVPAFMHAILPENVFFKKMSDICQIQVITTIAILLCVLFKVGDNKQALKMVPIDALLLICGVSLLVSVGMKAGAVDAMSEWVAENVSSKAAPYLLALVAGFYSYFASTVNVVVPSLGTLCAGISASTGISVPMCYSYLNTGSAWSAYSPFSSGGAITLAALHDEKQYNMLYKQALFLPFIAAVWVQLQILLGIFIQF